MKTITDRDPGDEHVDRDIKPDNVAGLAAAIRHAEVVSRALPIDPEAERMVDAMIAAQQPATSKRLLRPLR